MRDEFERVEILNSLSSPCKMPIDPTFENVFLEQEGFTRNPSRKYTEFELVEILNSTQFNIEDANNADF